MRGVTRRRMMRVAVGAATALCGAPYWVAGRGSSMRHGLVMGEPTAVHVGMRVLGDGGNAVDAVVAAAMAAAVAAPHQTGIGGYGGAVTYASGDGRTVCSIDFNTVAPAAARRDMFQPAAGVSPSERHSVGWLAAGVPGVLAGLQRLLDCYGCMPFRDLVQPAIAMARSGITIDTALARAIAGQAAWLSQDPGSLRLLLPNGNVPAVGDRLLNPDLADLLCTLADRNSVDSFYRGDIARHIADAFARNGGLVTAQDMAGYQTLDVAPLRLDWGPVAIHTAPLTAGGLTVLQTLAALRELKWSELKEPAWQTHALVESLGIAWRDRLRLLGDPRQVDVPVDRLLSLETARESAARVRTAVEQGRRIAVAGVPRAQSGTIHLSCMDDARNTVALTLTHGESFGAKVTVDGLGLTLGHGMSRFDVHAEHPNSPGPGKRPLHNMCPTVVTRGGRPVAAVGARGGRRIPNAVCQVLLHMIAGGRSMHDAVAAPRMHTEGTGRLELEKTWDASERDRLAAVGFEVATATSAYVSAVSLDDDGVIRAAAR